MAVTEKKTPEHKHPDSEMARRFKSNPFVFIGTFIVLVIVVVAFVLVPAIVPEYGRGGNLDLTFGYYDKVPISYVPGNFFAQYYERVARYRQNTDNEDPTYASIRLWREAFEAAAIHTAILQEMKKAGYTAPAKVVDREVAGLPYFQENGRFSPALYRQMDDNSRLSLWKQTQEGIAKAHFNSDVTRLLKPSAEGDFIGQMAAVERSFQMAVFPVNAYPDEEYTAYANANSGLFRSIHLSRITIGSSQREAERIRESILNGETTFEDAARSFSRDVYADRGGDMGIKMIYELVVDIPDSLQREDTIALASGEFSDVLPTAQGWTFFRIEEAIQEADLSDDAVLERIRYYVRNYERGRMEDWSIDKAANFAVIVNEIGFGDAALQENVEQRSFGPIPLNYGNIDLFATLASQSVGELAVSAADENFWRTAFSTPLDTPSRPLVQGAYVLVLFPTEEIEASESMVESIASIYNAYWLDYMSEQSMHIYFFTSKKMEDKFNDIYSRYFMGQ